MEKYKLLNIIIAACCLSALITFFAVVFFHVNFYIKIKILILLYIFVNKDLFEEK